MYQAIESTSCIIMKSNFLQFIIAIYLIAICACSGTKGRQEAHIIDVEAAVGTGAIHNASEYIEEFTYIPLETTQSSLIGSIQKIVIDNGKIYILDAKSRFNLFDDVISIFNIDGSYIGSLNRYGRGPEEYTRLINFAVTPEGNILIVAQSGIIEYDSSFKFIRKLNIPTENNRQYQDIIVLKNGEFASNMTEADFETGTAVQMWAIFDNSFNSKLSYSSNAGTSTQQFDGIVGISIKNRPYIQYLHDNTLTIFKTESDSIFNIDFEKGYSKSLRYTLNFGKYTLLENYKDVSNYNSNSNNASDANSITLLNIIESDNYIFMNFNFRGLALESYETEKISAILPDGRTSTGGGGKNRTVYGVYDKRTDEFHLLNQSIPGTLGLKNDIDSGPPVFWPRYFSAEKELVSYQSSESIISLIEEGKMDKSLIIGNITENDNPILVIAKER